MKNQSEIKSHYLRLWHEADKILKQPDNPCKIKPVDNGKFVCTGQGNWPSVQLCCSGCKHHGPTGCTVKSLGCKLGWCYCASRAITGLAVHSHPTFIAISKLRDEAIAL